ncbi:iron hydrogenase [Sesbania bispinosa]|nr:iron hydrogenase [Sesbania bispinosa]
MQKRIKKGVKLCQETCERDGGERKETCVATGPNDAVVRRGHARARGEKSVAADLSGNDSVVAGDRATAGAVGAERHAQRRDRGAV